MRSQVLRREDATDQVGYAFETPTEGVLVGKRNNAVTTLDAYGTFDTSTQFDQIEDPHTVCEDSPGQWWKDYRRPQIVAEVGRLVLSS